MQHRVTTFVQDTIVVTSNHTPNPYFTSVKPLERSLQKYVGEGLSIHNGWWGAKFGTKAESVGETMDYKEIVLFALHAFFFFS